MRKGKIAAWQGGVGWLQGLKKKTKKKAVEVNNKCSREGKDECAVTMCELRLATGRWFPLLSVW